MLNTIVSKKWYQSKTVWINALAIAGMIFESGSGVNFGLSATAKVTILSVINLILRAVTNKNIVL